MAEGEYGFVLVELVDYMGWGGAVQRITPGHPIQRIITQSSNLLTTMEVD